MLIHVKGDRWHAVNAYELANLAPHPTLRENCIVVWEPDRQLIGVMSLEGDSRHAAVLIERRLRSEGTIDEETKVLLHHVERVGTTYQALYSSVAVREWQQLHRWSSLQSTHCAWVPFVRLAWSRVTPDRAVVVHTSDALHFFARSGSRIVFCSVLLMDQEHESLIYSAAALSERARGELTKESGSTALESLHVTWLSSLVEIGENEAQQLHDSFGSGRTFIVTPEDMELLRDVDPGETVRSDREISIDLQKTASQLETAASYELQFADIVTPRQAQHGSPQNRMRTSLLALAQDPAIKLLLNGPREKVLITVERWFGLVVMCAAAFSAVGILLTASALREVKRLDQEIRVVQGDAATAETDVSATRDPEPEGAQAQLAFLSRLRKLRESFDVNDIIGTVREAAGTDLRILSVRSDDNPPKDGEVHHAILVDGLLPSDTKNPDSVALSEFVRALARNGYAAIPVESRTTGAAATDISSRLFSYRITRNDFARSKGSS